MKIECGHRLIAVALTVVLMHGVVGSAELHRFEALSSLPFSENRPTPETARRLRDELLFQRATQAYLWDLPLINTLGMQVGSEKVFGAGANTLAGSEMGAGSSCCMRFSVRAVPWRGPSAR